MLQVKEARTIGDDGAGLCGYLELRHHMEDSVSSEPLYLVLS
jgi:hypothetical protein